MLSLEAAAKKARFLPPLQCGIFAASILAFTIKVGSLTAWLLMASLLIGFASIIFGIIAALIARSPRWLWLSVASVFVIFFSALVCISIGGSLGV